ncbi:MAG: 3-oxoadipate enol-lactonase [Pseudomonadota bacterium]
MQFFDRGGIVLHYQTVGGPEGKPTLVFINALGSDFRIWRDVVIRMVGEYGCLNYDKRGHGLSSVGDTPYSLDDHASDLSALLDHLGIKDAVLVGLSIGGMIAQLLASKRPDLVKALVLCDTAYKIGTEALWNERIEAIQSHGMEKVADAVMDRWFTKTYRAENPADIAGYRNMVARMPQAGYIGTCAALRDGDLKEIAETLPIPVSCIVGDKDVSTPPAKVLELAKTIPGARYDVIKGAGHIPCVEQAPMMADIIKEFVGGL